MKKEKHDHKLTNILKFCCFAILMTMPLLQTCGKLLYVSFNPNAKNETTEITELNLYETIENDLNTTIQYPKFITYDRNARVVTDLPSGTYIYVRLVDTTDSNWLASIVMRLYNNNELGIESLNTYNPISQHNIKVVISSNNTIALNLIEQANIIFNYYEKIETNDNLINTIEKTHEKQMTTGILSWVDNTIAFNGINTMCVGLNITDNYIIYLITYWIMLTVIYVVIDIIIFAFTYLTHFFS